MFSGIDVLFCAWRMSAFEAKIFVRADFTKDRFGHSSAGHDQEACWSNPAQKTGQVECKRAGKSVQLSSQKLDCRVESCHAPPCLILGATCIADGQSPINVVDTTSKTKKT